MRFKVNYLSNNQRTLMFYGSQKQMKKMQEYFDKNFAKYDYQIFPTWCKISRLDDNAYAKLIPVPVSICRVLQNVTSLYMIRKYNLANCEGITTTDEHTARQYLDDLLTTGHYHLTEHTKNKHNSFVENEYIKYTNRHYSIEFTKKVNVYNNAIKCKPFYSNIFEHAY